MSASATSSNVDTSTAYSLQRGVEPSYARRGATYLSWVWQRGCNMYEIMSTFDLRPLFQRAIASSPRPVAQTTIDLFKVLNATGTPSLMREVFRHHRNDPHGIFEVGPNNPALGLIQMLLDDPTIEHKDFILSCGPERSLIYRSILENLFAEEKNIPRFRAEINRVVSKTLDSWSENEGLLDMNRHISLFVSEVISRGLIGYVPYAERPSYAEVADAIDLIGQFYVSKLSGAKIDPAQLAAAQKTIKLVLESTEEHLLEERAPLMTMLDKRRDTSETPANHMLTPKQIHVMLATLFVGGQETSGTVLKKLCWELATHSELQETLAKALCGIPAKNTKDTYDAIAKIIDPYLNEALRLMPPAFAISRMARAAIEVTEIATGKIHAHIPQGDGITACPFAAALNPAHFQNPTQFNPARSEKTPFYPFGAGVHRCPGQPFFKEIAYALIASLVARFKLTTTLSTEPASKGMIIDSYTEPMPIQLFPRN